MKTDQIRTDHLVLRGWTAADREPFAAMNRDPRVMEHFPGPLTREQSDAAVDRIEAHFDEHGYGLWVVEGDGRFLGLTGLAWVPWAAPFPTPALEVGWRLVPEAWGHGFASEAATAALARGFLEVDSIVSFTARTNTRSAAVMRRIGMHEQELFDHPRLPAGHPLRPHVLYRADRDSWPGSEPGMLQA